MGQTIYLQDFGSSAPFVGYYRVYDPYGNQIAGNWFNGGNNFEQALGAAGTYSVVVNNNGGSATGSYSFALDAVNVPPIPNAVPIQFAAESSQFTLGNLFFEPSAGATLTYSFLDSPAGMGVTSSGVIAWTPTQNQSPSTNIVTIVATSTGGPNVLNPRLSATNSFLVVVDGGANPSLVPGNPTIFAAMLLDDGKFQISFSSAVGTDYTLQYYLQILSIGILPKP